MKIQYICFTSYSGFAFSAKNNIKALISGGYDVSIKPLDLGFYSSINSRDFKKFKKLVDGETGDVQIYHCIPIMQRRVPSSGRIIGYGTFENIEIPQEWINVLQKNDSVIVPSLFNFNSFSAKLDNVVYIPHCLDFADYSYYNRRRSSPYRFLYFGTWKNRKNYNTLLRAFTEEFSEENVELVLKVSNEALKSPEKSISRISKQLGKTARIRVESQILKDEDISSYLRGFNCLVSPTLGEGFGYPGLQAMASGLPVIITNYSGCTEYANSETSLLLEVEGFEKQVDMDGILQFRNKSWPKISVKQLREKMRWAYKNKKEMQILAKNANDFVRDRFNYKSILNKFRDII